MDPQWRIVGIVRDASKARAMSADPTGTRIIDYNRYCHLITDTLDSVCEIDGRYITEFSGRVLSGVMSAATVKSLSE